MEISENEMKRHVWLISIVLLAIVFLTACAAGAAPAPTATPTTKPGIEIKVGETIVRIKEINFGKYSGARVTNKKEDLGISGGYEAKPGFQFAEVIAEISQGETAEKVSNWAVELQDSSGKTYAVVAASSGVFVGGENNIGWTFSIPENASQLKLILPEGSSVALSPLIGK